MRSNLLFSVFLTAILVSGCKVKVDHEPQVLEYHRYKSGLPMATVQIKDDDEIYRYIKALLDRHKAGWKPSSVNYAPCVKVRAYDDMYRLNICPDKLVLMYWDKEKTHTTQVVKKVSNKPYDGIVLLIEKALRGAEGGSGSEEGNP